MVKWQKQYLYIAFRDFCKLGQKLTWSCMRRSLTITLETIVLMSGANSSGQNLAMWPKPTIAVMKLAESGFNDFL